MAHYNISMIIYPYNATYKESHDNEYLLKFVFPLALNRKFSN